MDFFRNIFKSGSSVPPKKVFESLRRHFANARSIEWGRSNDLFEAIFFQDDAEIIARFDLDGQLVEYRLNMMPDRVPSIIMASGEEKGEVMNCIAVYTSESLKYELIIRNKELTRFLLWLDSLGNEVRMEPL